MAVTTNVFVRAAHGWRMIVHHASPAPTVTQEVPSDSPKVLH